MFSPDQINVALNLAAISILTILVALVKRVAENGHESRRGHERRVRTREARRSVDAPVDQNKGGTGNETG